LTPRFGHYRATERQAPPLKNGSRWRWALLGSNQ
jgi:hypothetical protein